MMACSLGKNPTTSVLRLIHQGLQWVGDIQTDAFALSTAA